MKVKNILFISFCIFAACFVLSGCGRKKIDYDEGRARQQLIPIEQARQYQQKFIATHEELSRFVSDTSFLKRRFNLPNSESFNRDMIALLLNQEGADGIRIYYGEDDKGQIRLVLIPVDKSGNDIMFSRTSALVIPGISGANAQGGNEAGENGQGCPPCIIH